MTIKNQRILLTLTFVAAAGIALLDQPDIPQKFNFITFFSSQLPDNPKFTWRHVQGHKILTVQSGTADIESDRNKNPPAVSVLPYMLNAQSDYEEGVDLKSALFFLKDLHFDDDIIYQAVCIVDTLLSQDFTRTNEISPFNLVGTENYRGEIVGTKFNWRYIWFDHYIKFKVVTLEH